MDVKEKLKNSDTWLRGFFILVFGVVFYFLYGIIWLLIVFQFVAKLFTGNLNERLAQFSSTLTGYAMQILLYMTFQSDERPFPFSSFPAGDAPSESKPKKAKGGKK